MGKTYREERQQQQSYIYTRDNKRRLSEKKYESIYLRTKERERHAKDRGCRC